MLQLTEGLVHLTYTVCQVIRCIDSMFDPDSVWTVFPSDPLGPIEDLCKADTDVSDP